MFTMRLRIGKAEQGDCNSSKDERLHLPEEGKCLGARVEQSDEICRPMSVKHRPAVIL